MLPSVWTLWSTNYLKASTTSSLRLPGILKRGILTPFYHIWCHSWCGFFSPWTVLKISHFIGSLHSFKNLWTFFNSLELISDSEMSFALSKPRKAQHSGPLHRVSVAAWRLNVSICPVKAWKLIYTILQHCAMPQLFPSYAQQQQTPWSGLCSYNWPLDKGATQNNRYWHVYHHGTLDQGGSSIQSGFSGVPIQAV
jgi:hypothetical protein